jgi:hypothetical protein
VKTVTSSEIFSIISPVHRGSGDSVQISGYPETANEFEIAFLGDCNAEKVIEVLRQLSGCREL